MPDVLSPQCETFSQLTPIAPHLPLSFVSEDWNSNRLQENMWSRTCESWPSEVGLVKQPGMDTPLGGELRPGPQRSESQKPRSRPLEDGNRMPITHMSSTHGRSASDSYSSFRTPPSPTGKEHDGPAWIWALRYDTSTAGVLRHAKPKYRVHLPPTGTYRCQPFRAIKAATISRILPQVDPSNSNQRHQDLEWQVIGTACSD